MWRNKLIVLTAICLIGTAAWAQKGDAIRLLEHDLNTCHERLQASKKLNVRISRTHYLWDGSVHESKGFYVKKKDYRYTNVDSVVHIQTPYKELKVFGHIEQMNYAEGPLGNPNISAFDPDEITQHLSRFSTIKTTMVAEGIQYTLINSEQFDSITVTINTVDHYISEMHMFFTPNAPHGVQSQKINYAIVSKVPRYHKNLQKFDYYIVPKAGIWEPSKEFKDFELFWEKT